jgi:pyridoxamine 5'-phosphate oxidase
MSENKPDDQMNLKSETHSEAYLDLEQILDIKGDPVNSVVEWVEFARSKNISEPNAMALATVDRDSKPSLRMVLFKGTEEAQGSAKDSRTAIQFFTNYKSRKSADMMQNPYIAATFHWGPLGRQVRIEGRVEKTSRDESEKYYKTRARGSQIGAWSSPQSQVIGSRAELEELVAKTEKKFKNETELQCPVFWGGWKIIPDAIEFWEARDSRLHERIKFIWKPEVGWITVRLAP